MTYQNSSISFSGLVEQYERIKDEINPAIDRAVKSGWYILGKELESLEKEFAGYCGVEYAIGCASGTEAIALSLMSLDIKSGDEVITVSNTAVPTVSAISMVGAIPPSAFPSSWRNPRSVGSIRGLSNITTLAPCSCA